VNAQSQFAEELMIKNYCSLIKTMTTLVIPIKTFSNLLFHDKKEALVMVAGKIYICGLTKEH
jgi:hypothetical protein